MTSYIKQRDPVFFSKYNFNGLDETDLQDLIDERGWDITIKNNYRGTIVYTNTRGLPHRIDGPAIIYQSGLQQYWVNGKLYNMQGGPTKTYKDKESFVKDNKYKIQNAMYDNPKEYFHSVAINNIGMKYFDRLCLEYFKDNYELVSVGSGSGECEQYIRDLVRNVIVYDIDPYPEKYVRKPDYDYTTSFILDKPELVGNVNLLLNWPFFGEEGSYDFEAIKLLQPRTIMIIGEVKGASGSPYLLDFLNKIYDPWKFNDVYFGEYGEEYPEVDILAKNYHLAQMVRREIKCKLGSTIYFIAIVTRNDIWQTQLAEVPAIIY